MEGIIVYERENYFGRLITAKKEARAKRFCTRCVVVYTKPNIPSVKIGSGFLNFQQHFYNNLPNYTQYES